jgi:hypothetical protein
MSRNVSILSVVAAMLVTVLVVVTVAFAAQDDGGGLGQEKVALCHKGHTMTVDALALAAHQGHGDTEGACPTDTETPARTEGTPAGDQYGKVTLCHKDKNTLTVGAPALAAHQGHGDTEGACPTDTETPARTEHTTPDTAADDKGDEIANDATHDVMNGLPAGADVYGASAADTLHGTPYTDFLQGGRGPDRMFGGGGKDYIDGVDGIAGNDKLHGDLGIDHCVGDKGDTFEGCEGNVVAVPVPSASSAPTEAGH